MCEYKPGQLLTIGGHTFQVKQTPEKSIRFACGMCSLIQQNPNLYIGEICPVYCVGNVRRQHKKIPADCYLKLIK